MPIAFKGMAGDGLDSNTILFVGFIQSETHLNPHPIKYSLKVLNLTFNLITQAGQTPSLKDEASIVLPIHCKKLPMQDHTLLPLQEESPFFSKEIPKDEYFLSDYLGVMKRKATYSNCPLL
jgi:hypothetical protein